MVANLSSTLTAWNWPTTPAWYLMVTILALLSIVILEPNPVFHRSVQRMLVVGLVLGLLKIIATGATLFALLLLPYERLRAVIISCLALCALITLVREWVRRWRGGDHSPSSYIGGLFVSIQTASFLLLISSAIALIIEAILAPARILESDAAFGAAIRGWIEVMATLLVLVTLYYIGFTLVRRILGVTGFSWVDPPNWRTLLPHLKYQLGPRVGWPPWQESQLADAVRIAYVKHLVGSTELEAVVEAARIEPINDPHHGFTYAVIGDPGEGDRSQLRPVVEEPQISQAMQLSNGPFDAPGFVIISSDIVYPAGELMDYERTVYRPYSSPDTTHQPLWYGLPGNHDWYNNLKGMLLNFGYPAAQTTASEARYARWRRGMRTGPWARYGFFTSAIRYSEAAYLRRTYALPHLGGIIDQPRTHQRLPFWEMYFEEAPLTILGIDTGSVGSIDEIQHRWLIDRLQAAYAQDKIIMVLLSEPLYVDGTFAAGKQLRELYALLQRFKVQVIMGGDTHAYQYYRVDYSQQNQTYTAHHFVNGGGGAYLSPPLDLRWDAALPLRPESLAWSFKDETYGIHDHVELLDFYPSAEQLREKFAVPDESGLRGYLRQFETTLLQRGFTTALDHDRAPLLQSFVTCSLVPPPEGWLLRITPWFTTGPNNSLQPQPAIDIQRGAHTAKSAMPPGFPQ